MRHSKQDGSSHSRKQAQTSTGIIQVQPVSISVLITQELTIMTNKLFFAVATALIASTALVQGAHADSVSTDRKSVV